MPKNKTFALILLVCTYMLVFYYVVVPKYKEYKKSQTSNKTEVNEFDALNPKFTIPGGLKLTKMNSQVYMIEDINSVGNDQPFRASIYIQKITDPNINLAEKALSYCTNINIPVESVKERCTKDINKTLKQIQISKYKGVEFTYLHFEYYVKVVLLLVGDKLFEFTLYSDVGDTLVPEQIEVFDKIVTSFRVDQ